MAVHNYVKKLEKSNSKDLSTAAGLSIAAPVGIQSIPTTAPVKWLKCAMLDVRASRYLSLLYGVCFVLMGLGIDRAHSDKPFFTLVLSAGFVFMGPFLALGLYELSRQHQAGEKVELILSLFSWCRNPATVGRFAALLSLIMVFWLWLSLTLQDVMEEGLSLPLFGLITVWVAIALLVFLGSVVGIPMMLDRPVSAHLAITSSVRCCFANPAAFAIWAAIIALLVAFSVVLGYWPLLVIGPILGHATWHAYQSGLTTADLSNTSESSEERSISNASIPDRDS